MRKMRLVCMKCSKAIELPRKTADGKQCECGGCLLPMEESARLDVKRSAGISPPG